MRAKEEIKIGSPQNIPTFLFLCLSFPQENNLLPGLFEPGGYSLRNQAKGMLEVLRLAVCSEFDSRVSVRPSNIPLSHTYDSRISNSELNTPRDDIERFAQIIIPVGRNE